MTGCCVGDACFIFFFPLIFGERDRQTEREEKRREEKRGEKTASGRRRERERVKGVTAEPHQKHKENELSRKKMDQ